MAVVTTQTETLTCLGEDEHNLERSIPLRQHESNLSLHSESRPGLARISRIQKVAVTIQLSGVTFASSVSNGIVIVALPAITKDLQLPPSLAFWPVSVSGLATASTLLLAGSIADALGPRWVDLVGCLASGLLMIGCGAVQNGTGLVAMRAIQGVGLAMHLACAVSVVTQVLPQGKSRNLAFSCLGMSQPLGFSVGLLLGGILVDTIGWRSGWFLAGGLTLLFTAIGFWAIPSRPVQQDVRGVMHGFKTTVDWVGAVLASVAMTLLCYLLAILSADVSRIKEPTSISFLCLSFLATVSFIYWMHYQVSKGAPALIPNKLWSNGTFSTICLITALSFAVINSMELFCSLFFQEIQNLSAIQASIRIVPSTLLGVVVNMINGLYVHKVSAVWIVTATAIPSAIAPLLMAVINPSAPYWGNAFVAQMLQQINCNALFTVGLIIITDIFPPDTQALAGAVFNTAPQFGSAVGFAIMQVISATVTKRQKTADEEDAAMAGYRASFWAMFSLMVLCTLVGIIGLRKTGKVGVKRD